MMASAWVDRRIIISDICISSGEPPTDPISISTRPRTELGLSLGQFNIKDISDEAQLKAGEIGNRVLVGRS